MLCGRFLVQVVGIVVVSALVVGCALSDEVDPPPTTSSSRAASASPGMESEPHEHSVPAHSATAKRWKRRVLAISVDGLNPEALTVLGRRGSPHFHRLMDEGAYTLNARTEVEQTVTLPNHTGMLTGRRINPSNGGHGVVWNDGRAGTVQEAAGHAVDSVFTTVSEAGGETALFSAKEKFAIFDRSWGEAIDEFRIDTNNNELVSAARRDLVEHRRAFTFLHLSLPDVSGHAHGFMSSPYLRAVGRTDALLGSLLQSIDSKGELRDHLVVLLTADHGGAGEGHADSSDPDNYRVPFVVWGAGIASADLYALNPDYRDPGRGLSAYSGQQPVRNGDLANLSTDLLGLTPVAGSEFSVKQELDVSVN